MSSRQNSITTVNRLNLLHTNTASNNISRDYSWKRLLRIDENYNKRQLVKEVFDDGVFDKNNLVQSLNKICNESKVNDWREYFISNPELMKYCTKGFIKVDNPNQIYLLNSIYCGANQYFAEMYTYNLWKNNIEPNRNSYLVFKECYYHEVKSSDEEACIILDDFYYNGIHYEVNIYYSDNDELPNPYELVFRKSDGEKYGEDIKSVLTGQGFEWYEDYRGYFFTSQDSDTLMEKLIELNNELQNL